MAALTRVGEWASGRAGECLLPRSPALPLPRSETRWLLGWGAALLAVTAMPYVVWLLWGRPDLERMGTFWFYRDFSQYLAAMHSGLRSDSWLLYNHFSAEPHAPIVMYPLYVALGKLAAALRADLLTVYYATEVLGRVALIAALYQFVALFSQSVAARRLAFLLAAFSLGLAGWAVPLRLLFEALGVGGLAELLPEKINPYLEMNSFGVFFSGPHLMLGLALTLVIPRAYLAVAQRGPAVVPVGLLVVLCVSLAVVHSFNLPVVLSVLLAHSLVTAVRARKLGPGLAVLAALVASAPPLLYSAAMFQLDPFWSQTYGAQNSMPSPPLLSLLVDYGLVLILAPLGVWWLRGDRTAATGFLLLWCVIGLAWMYLPVPYQRRFGFGLQPAFSMLAATALLFLFYRVRHRPLARRFLSYGALLLAVTTTVIVYVALLFSAAINRPTTVYAWTRADGRAVAWLAEHSGPEDVVLAETASARTMAGILPGRVVYGHVVATYRAKEKEALKSRFFSGEAPPEELEALLRESRATLVYYGPEEAANGEVPLHQLSSLRSIYEQDGVKIYRALSPGSGG